MPLTRAWKFKPQPRLEPTLYHWWQARKADMLTFTPCVAPIAAHYLQTCSVYHWWQARKADMLTFTPCVAPIAVHYLQTCSVYHWWQARKADMLTFTPCVAPIAVHYMQTCSVYHWWQARKADMLTFTPCVAPIAVHYLQTCSVYHWWQARKADMLTFTPRVDPIAVHYLQTCSLYLHLSLPFLVRLSLPHLVVWLMCWKTATLCLASVRMWSWTKLIAWSTWDSNLRCARFWTICRSAIKSQTMMMQRMTWKCWKTSTANTSTDRFVLLIFCFFLFFFKNLLFFSQSNVLF